MSAFLKFYRTFRETKGTEWVESLENAADAPFSVNGKHCDIIPSGDFEIVVVKVYRGIGDAGLRKARDAWNFLIKNHFMPFGRNIRTYNLGLIKDPVSPTLSFKDYFGIVECIAERLGEWDMCYDPLTDLIFIVDKPGIHPTYLIENVLKLERGPVYVPSELKGYKG